MTASFKNIVLPVRYCTVCLEPIPPERVARHSPFCSNEHAKQHKNEMRAVMAGKKCRLCRRRFPKPRGLTVNPDAPKLFKEGAPGAQEPLSASESRS